MPSSKYSKIQPIHFFFNDTATTEIYTLSLHDALPISIGVVAIGVLVYGEATFEQLMVEHGETVAVARAMFEQTVSAAFVLAGLAAAAVSLTLALLLARRIE